MLDGYDGLGLTSYGFMKFARNIINNFEGNWNDSKIEY
jgi:hypothetical protein